MSKKIILAIIIILFFALVCYFISRFSNDKNEKYTLDTYNHNKEKIVESFDSNTYCIGNTGISTLINTLINNPYIYNNSSNNPLYFSTRSLDNISSGKLAIWAFLANTAYLVNSYSISSLQTLIQNSLNNNSITITGLISYTYSSNQGSNNITKNIGYAMYDSFTNSFTYCFSGSLDTNIVNLGNPIDDILNCSVSISLGNSYNFLISNYFYKLYYTSGIQQNIINILGSQGFNASTYNFIGHGLGGGIAQIAAIDLFSTCCNYSPLPRPKNINGIFFSSPTVFENSQWQNYVTTNMQYLNSVCNFIGIGSYYTGTYPNTEEYVLSNISLDFLYAAGSFSDYSNTMIVSPSNQFVFYSDPEYGGLQTYEQIHKLSNLINMLQNYSQTQGSTAGLQYTTMQNLGVTPGASKIQSMFTYSDVTLIGEPSCNSGSSSSSSNMSMIPYEEEDMNIEDAAVYFMFMDTPDIEITNYSSSGNSGSFNTGLSGDFKKLKFKLDLNQKFRITSNYKVVPGLIGQSFTNLLNLKNDLQILKTATYSIISIPFAVQTVDFPQSVAVNILTWLTITDVSYVVRGVWNKSLAITHNYLDTPKLQEALTSATTYINDLFNLPSTSGVVVKALTYGNYAGSNNSPLNAEIPMGCIISNTINNKNIFCISMVGTTWPSDLKPQGLNPNMEGAGIFKSVFDNITVPVYNALLQNTGNTFEYSVSSFYKNIYEGITGMGSAGIATINGGFSPNQQIQKFLADRISEINNSIYTYSNPLIINISGHSMGGAMGQIVTIHVLATLGLWLQNQTADTLGRYKVYINCFFFAPPSIIKLITKNKIYTLPGFATMPNITIVSFGNYYNRYIYGPNSSYGMQIDPVYYAGNFGSGLGVSYLIIPEENSFLLYLPSYVFNPWDIKQTVTLTVHLTSTTRKYLLNTNTYNKSLTVIRAVKPFVTGQNYSYSIGLSSKLFTFSTYSIAYITSVPTGLVTNIYEQQMIQTLRNIDINSYYSNIFTSITIPGNTFINRVSDINITNDGSSTYSNIQNLTTFLQTVQFWLFLSSLPYIYRKIWSLNFYTEGAAMKPIISISNPIMQKITSTIKNFIIENNIFPFTSDVNFNPLTYDTGGVPIGNIIKYDYSVNGNTYIYICFMGSPYPFIDIYKNNNFYTQNIANSSTFVNIQGTNINCPKFYYDMLNTKSSCPLGTNSGMNLSVLEQIRVQLMPILDTTNQKYIKVIGHSLGGALAQIVSLYLNSYINTYYNSLDVIYGYVRPVIDTILFSPASGISYSTRQYVPSAITNNCISFSQYCNIDAQHNDLFPTTDLDNVYIDLVSYPLDSVSYNILSNIVPDEKQYLIFNSITNLDKDIHSLNSLMLNVYNNIVSSSPSNYILSYSKFLDNALNITRLTDIDIKTFQSGPLIPNVLMDYNSTQIQSTRYEPIYNITLYKSIILILSEILVQNSANCPVNTPTNSLGVYSISNNDVYTAVMNPTNTSYLTNIGLYLTRINQIMYNLLNYYNNASAVRKTPVIDSNFFKSYANTFLYTIFQNFNKYSCVKLLISGQNDQTNLCGMVLSQIDSYKKNLIFVFSGSTIPLMQLNTGKTTLNYLDNNIEYISSSFSALKYYNSDKSSFSSSNFNTIKYYADQLSVNITSGNSLDGKADNIISQYESIIDQYLNIQNPQDITNNNIVNITITGHGIGGALAQNVYASLQTRTKYGTFISHGRINIQLAIFSSPYCFAQADIEQLYLSFPSTELYNTISFGLCTPLSLSTGKTYCDPVFGSYEDSLVPLVARRINQTIVMPITNYNGFIRTHQLSSFINIFNSIISGSRLNNYYRSVVYDTETPIDITQLQGVFSLSDDHTALSLCS